MAIDSRIPLSVEAPRFNSPFETLAQINQTRLQQQAVNSNQALEEERRQQIAARNVQAQELDQYKQIIGNPDLTPESFLEQVRVKAPGQYDAARARLDAHDKAALEMKTLRQNAADQTKKWIGGMLDDVAQSGYNPAIAELALKKIEAEEPDFAPKAAAIRQQLLEGGPPALKALIDQMRPKSPDAKTREVKVRNPDGSETTQIVEDKPGQTFQSAAPPKPEPASIDAALLAATRAKDGPEVRRLLNLKAQMNAAGRAPDQEPLVPIVDPVTGKSVLVRRSQAEGKQPASSREQGRPVTSGDAGKLAELDTSLNDLATLAQTLGTTGAGSKVGAMLPNVVTEYTGWGSDSKSRQGTIDRVKQVIGKALEGGVLRKEDEAKYEKILPTIGDPPAVAKTKLEGLQKALVLRRQTTIDALKDANYDVSNFEKRTTAPKKIGRFEIEIHD